MIRNCDEYRYGLRPRSVVSTSSTSMFVMSRVAREFFTVDLRGLRAALAARAADAGMTESDVLRSALAAALGCGSGAVVMPPSTGDGPGPLSCHVKLSVRLTRAAAFQLDRHACAAGLSRGAYLTRLIEGAPPV